MVLEWKGLWKNHPITSVPWLLNILYSILFLVLPPWVFSWSCEGPIYLLHSNAAENWVCRASIWKEMPWINIHFTAWNFLSIVFNNLQCFSFKTEIFPNYSPLALQTPSPPVHKIKIIIDLKKHIYCIWLNKCTLHPSRSQSDVGTRIRLDV